MSFGMQRQCFDCCGRFLVLVLFCLALKISDGFSYPFYIHWAPSEVETEKQAGYKGKGVQRLYEAE
jgi:hypothetical protein